jgi:hypothetical protein
MPCTLSPRVKTCALTRVEMSYQRYKSPCPVIIWGHFGAENYILTQNRHVTGKSTNIKTITYTLKRESYTPPMRIYQPLMCYHIVFQ